jgi:hypothetical protein
MISGEVRTSIIVSIGSHLTRRPPRRIDCCATYARKEHPLARCVAAVGDKGWGKGAGGDDSWTMWIVALIGHGGRRRPMAATGQHPRQ